MIFSTILFIALLSTGCICSKWILKRILIHAHIITRRKCFWKVIICCIWLSESSCSQTWHGHSALLLQWLLNHQSWVPPFWIMQHLAWSKMDRVQVSQEETTGDVSWSPVSLQGHPQALKQFGNHWPKIITYTKSPPQRIQRPSREHSHSPQPGMKEEWSLPFSNYVWSDNLGKGWCQ